MNEELREIVVEVPHDKAWIIPILEALRDPGESLEEMANRILMEAKDEKMRMRKA